MDSIIRRYCKLILLVAVLVEAQNSSSDESLPEFRRPRTTGRIVKLYAGYKPEPIKCNGEGFQGDPKDCGIFYRCTQSGNGNFTVFKFQCAPGTVYDPEMEVCNYPQSTKRLECGGLSNDMNEIDEIQQEFHSPIITKVPIYTDRTTVHQNLENFPDGTHNNLITQTTNKKPDMNKSTLSTSTTGTSSTYSWNQYSSSSTIQPSPPTNNKQTLNSANVTSDNGLSFNQKLNWQNSICRFDGFMGDYENCHKFYRCVRNQMGGFTKYEFSCSDSTVWDDDIQACNHPWAVRRSRCGKSGSNIDSTKVLSTVPQSTSPKISTSLNNNDNPKNQKQFNNIPNINQSQASSAHQLQVKNQTEINYGDNNLDKTLGNQNETSIKETQNQIINKNDEIKTQLQIDHANQLTQKPTTITYSTTKSSSSPFYDKEDKYLSHVNALNSNECTNSGFIGDPKNCKVFYRCVDNGKGGYTKYEFSCGEGTFWDQKLEACNHAWAVNNCGSEQSLQDTEITSPSTIQLSPSTIKSTQSYITSIQTTEKNVATFEEPSYNDENVGYNNHNQNYTTTTSSHTLVTTTVNTLQNANNECRSSRFIGDTMNCKIFYRCIDDGKGGYTKHKFECGEGTVWDSHIEACNYAEAVHNCGGNIVLSTEATISKGTTVLSNNGITKPSYITTTQLQINSELPDNKFEFSYDIHNDTISSPTGTVQQNNSKSDNECKSVGFFGVKNNCKKFYRCVDSGDNSFIRYEFSCSEGTLWDSKIESCNHAWAVNNCSSDEISTINEETVQSNPPKGHKENNSINTIQKPNYTSTTTHEITQVTSTIKTEVGNTCTESGFIGDVKDCKKFYRCVDNGNGGFTKYDFTCGEGTAWDVNIRGCNHIHLVESCRTSSSTPEIITDDAVYSTTMITTSSQDSNSTDTSENCNWGYKDNCSDEGYFGNIDDCKKFYRCVDDGQDGYIKYDFTCGDGTIWDQDIDACNHPEDVENPTCQSSTEESSTTGCSTTMNTTTLSTTIRPSTITTQNGEQLPNTTQETSEQPVNSNYSCTEDGYFPNPNDCKKFYRCVDDGKDGYLKYDFTCGDGTIWDQDIDACNHPEDVENPSCQSSTEENSTTDSSTSMNTTTISTTTQPSTITTQNGEQLTNTTQETSKQPVSSNFPCTEAGYFPNPNNCKKFYRCVDDGKDGYLKYDFTCGDGTIWDQDITACNHPEDVENPSCQSNTEANSTTDCSTAMNNTTILTTTQSSTVTTENGDKLPNTTQETTKQPVNSNFPCTEAGYFPNPNDCKKFYRCVDDGKDGYLKYDFTCGDGTIWDQDIAACNHPEDVENPSCQLSTEGNSTTDCSTPINNTTISTTTQPSTVTTENVEKLPNTNTTNTTQKTTKQPVNNNFTCTEAGYFPNPNDCKKFYRCVDWDGDGSSFSIFHFECGEGTIWDPKLETCNHEESVIPPRVCSGTQSQTESLENGTSTTEVTTIQEITTQQTITSSPQTTTQTTIQQTTTSKCTTSLQTTTLQPSTTDKTTTLESTTGIQTTSEPTTVQQQTTTTTSQATTNEQSTHKQSTITEETTTQQSFTTTTEKEFTTKKPTTTTQISSESTTIDNTTTQKSTTEENTQHTTVNNVTTTEQTTSTESSTTDGLTLTTTQTSTETSTNKGDQETTTENTSTSLHKCPETDDEQHLFVCPTSFRRHPKYCNLFYQCTEEDDTHDAKIAVFTCPNNTIYDESKVQCVEENKAEKNCEGEIASRRRVKRLGFLYKEPIVVTADTHSCEATGYVPFEKNSECSPAFLKCEKSKSGKLRGYVYQCPENYIYWSISRKCERRENVRDCKRTTNNWSGRWEIPIEKHNVTW